MSRRIIVRHAKYILIIVIKYVFMKLLRFENAGTDRHNNGNVTHQ